MAEIAVNLLMENLKRLKNCKIDLILEQRDQIESVYEDLRLLRTFLKDWEEKFYKHEELKYVETQIRDSAYEIENTIDLFIVNSILKKGNTIKEDIGMVDKIGHFYNFMKKKKIGKAEKIDHVFDRVKRKIDAIKTEVMEIYANNVYYMGALQIGNSSNGDSSRAITPTWEEETMVGFDEEAMIIKEQLTRGPKQLEVLSIVGMAGLGKTTLARKLYNDPLIKYHFHIRAWTYVSENYKKRDLLLSLLSSVIQHTNGIDQIRDEKLAEKLYKGLKGRIYFIVMDDIWDSRAWVDLKNCFPNDNNGSRILFTSRLESVALHAKTCCPPLSLRFLTHDESWDLLRQKVFRRQTCPLELLKIGKKIAIKCRGLPLAIVVVAGILANEEKRKDRWKQVGETINSGLVADSQLWMKTIALSYKQLPNHLKPCFLYFGAFPKNFQIPVWKLIWLWVAEGFIRKTAKKCLEDIAEDYLKDLIGRSLVLVSRRGYDGKIKACGIHDLLRDFCYKKAEEEYFMKQIWDRQHFSSSPCTSKYFSSMRVRRLCIHPDILLNTSLTPSCLNTRSFLCIASGYTGLLPPEFLSRCFKLLRVLDITSIGILRYPSEIDQLILLRYLALGTLFSETFLPASISNLWNLQTLILGTRSSITLPQCIRKMAQLRHLRLSGVGMLEIGSRNPDALYPFSLENLQTLSWVNPWSCGDLLARSPNLRKLGFRGDIVNRGFLRLPDIHSLIHLQKLKLSNTNVMLNCSTELGRIKFPRNLKKLTLEKTHLKWDQMSALGKLVPKLEVLKLLSCGCSGRSWETSDGVFARLKFLKFESLDIAVWNASSNNFPSLQRLVLNKCYFLKKIPTDLGDILTLQMIEIQWCNRSIADSAREIKEEQESVGNNWLQIIESYI